MDQPRKCTACGVSTLRARYCESCEYMSQDDAAKRLKVSRRTYYRLVGAGKINPWKIGLRKTLVARQEIDNLLSGHSFPR